MTHSPFWCWLTEILKKRVECSLQVAFVLWFSPLFYSHATKKLSRWKKIRCRGAVSRVRQLEFAENIELEQGWRLISFHQQIKAWNFSFSALTGSTTTHPLSDDIQHSTASSKPVRNSFFLAIRDWMLFLADVLCLLPWKLDRCVYFSGDWN